VTLVVQEAKPSSLNSSTIENWDNDFLMPGLLFLGNFLDGLLGLKPIFYNNSVIKLTK